MEPEVDEIEDDSQEDSVNPGYAAITVGTAYEDPDTGSKEKMDVTIQVYVGEDLQTAVERFGEEVVFERYLRGIKKDAGNSARARLNFWLGQIGQPGAPELDEISHKVEEEHATWEPGVTRRRGRKPKEVSAAEFLANFNLMPPDKQAAILAEIMAKVGE